MDRHDERPHATGDGHDRRREPGHGAVLFYHSVGTDHGDSYGRTISEHRLALDIEAWLDRGYRIVDLTTAVETGGGGGRLALTFDDGYESFATRVVPLLERFDVPATVYVHTDAIGSSNHLTETQLRDLFDHDLVTVGNHTRSHPYLDRVDDHGTLVDEIVGARTTFERRFGVAPDHFAYPFYRFDERSLTVVRDSHETAVAGPPGHPAVGPADPLSTDSDPHLLPRVDGVTLSVLSNAGGCRRLLDGLGP
ncbi:polysaccharide deacetylase family protein [Halomarina oriensis]|uniref:Polysaccharide deacetylase family protein n=1 Tax=Halomarina oriensis TaxID=671145 RepID=A0A6B0GNX7_9EURY|nr:polysaccharide deacetylase family protein [Halomarina oriensis]MWG33845.1 polysaccharide deacetylase family protein [Halomarina oriensis]